MTTTELSTTDVKKIMESMTIHDLASCFEDTTSYDPLEWLWTKDQIINQVLNHMNEEYRDSFIENLETYRESK